MVIWFVTDSIRWTVDRLHGVNSTALGGGVGGAEAMTVGLCRHLADRGHTVTIWATKCDAPGWYGPILWRRAESLRRALMTEPSPDVIVSVRRPEVFSLPEAQAVSSQRVLWAHDVLERSQGLIPLLANVDTTVYVSEWHRRQWEEVCPSLARQFYSWVTPVASEARWFVPHAPVDDQVARQTFLYASAPDRGLVPLLQMWPRIKTALPEATLIVTGYSADISRITIIADRLIEKTNAAVGGVVLARSLDKPGYYATLAKCRLLLYPGVYFQETNGHVCSEAMAAGVIPLVSKMGALPETLPETAGVLFDGDAESADYQDRYVAEVLRLASPDADAEVAHRQAVGKAHVLPRITYDFIADLWDTRLRLLPVERTVATW